MIALIAGTGGLPKRLVAQLAEDGQRPIICQFHDFEPDVPEGLPRLQFRLETFGGLLAQLQQQGVDRLCMAGAVTRHPIDPSLIDAATAPLVPRIAAAIGKGDDGTLREFIAIIEEHGIKVVGAADICPDLLPAAGVHGAAPLPEGAETAALAAEAALRDMAAQDLGQAVLIQDGQVIARESQDGTAALLADAPAGAVLFKAPKPGQELRADMPLVGADTARALADAGAAGLIIEAGGVMTLDLAQMVDILDAAGAFFWVRPKGGQ